MQCLLGAAVPSVLRVWGEMRSLHHDPGGTLASADELDKLELVSNRPDLGRNGSCSWANARAVIADPQQPLLVAVFGGSVTAGCGAAFPSFRCDSLTSWTRMLHDKLVAELGQQVEVHVWGKNAIRADYFTQCTSEKLSERTNVVLLELQPNLWMRGQRQCPNCALYLEEVVEHVRRIAPRAAIALIGWPIAGRVVPIEPVMRQVAAQRGLDLWLASSWTRTQKWAGFRKTHNISGGGLYADEVHPNLLGHTLLANGASRLMLERLFEKTACEGVLSVPVPPPKVQEWCYLTADRLPLKYSGAVRQHATHKPVGQHVSNASRGGSGWSLVDEGGSKDVRKLGFLSTSEGGSPLLLGPLPRCSELFLNLGVLQSWSTDFGGLRIRCSGPCTCADIGANEVIETSASRVVYSSGKVELENATITVTHPFRVLYPSYQKPGNCYLELTHVAPAHDFPDLHSNWTRVRVDSLAVKALQHRILPHKPSKCASTVR
jgi:hypothetical protein